MSGYRLRFADIQDALETLLVEPMKAAGFAYFTGNPASKANGLKRFAWSAADPDSTLSRHTSGHRSRTESGSVLIKALALEKTTDYKKVRDAAFDAADVLEDALALDRTLDGLVEDCFISSVKGREGVVDTQRQYGLDIVVTYRCHNGRTVG